MDKYESREYCKESGCNIQRLLDDPSVDNDLKKQLKEDVCKEQCSAYDFHQYLQDNGYAIVKKKGLNKVLDEFKDSVRTLDYLINTDMPAIGEVRYENEGTVDKYVRLIDSVRKSIGGE